MKKANQRREGMVQSPWSLDGKLYIKTSPSGTLTKIYCLFSSSLCYSWTLC